MDLDVSEGFLNPGGSYTGGGDLRQVYRGCDAFPLDYTRVIDD
jgi:hypothetical protein